MKTENGGENSKSCEPKQNSTGERLIEMAEKARREAGVVDSDWPTCESGTGGTTVRVDLLEITKRIAADRDKYGKALDEIRENLNSPNRDRRRFEDIDIILKAVGK